MKETESNLQLEHFHPTDLSTSASTTAKMTTGSSNIRLVVGFILHNDLDTVGTLNGVLCCHKVCTS